MAKHGEQTVQGNLTIIHSYVYPLPTLEVGFLFKLIGI